MTNIPLNKVTCNSQFVKSRLKVFLEHMKTWKCFKPTLSILVYSYGYKADFVAFEVKDYNYSFMSADYKPSHMLLPDINVSDTNYESLRNLVETFA